MDVLRSLVAWLDRLSAWTPITAISAMIAAFIAGSAGIYWSFPLLLQVVILLAVAVLLTWGIGKIAAWLVLHSPRAVQNRIFSLWQEGDAFMKAGTATGPEWEAWASRVRAIYAERGDAGDRSYLAPKLDEHNTAAAMRGLRALGRRLNKERRPDE